MALSRREVLALGGVAAAAALAGALVGVLGLQSKSDSATLLSYPLRGLDGRSTRLGDWPAPLLLCNFWATWCAPCREEIPLLIAAKQQHAANGLEIAGIGIDQADKLTSFAKEFGINYPVLTPEGDATALLRALGDEAGALPYSLLLDRQRHVVYRRLGLLAKPTLEKEIRAAIG